MSYILDALKKSERARGGSKIREEFEEFPEAPAMRPGTSANFRPWVYLLAFILFVNLSVLLFWGAHRRKSAPPPANKPVARRSPQPAPLGESARGKSAPGFQGPSASLVPAAASPAPQAARKPFKPFHHAASKRLETTTHPKSGRLSGTAHSTATARPQHGADERRVAVGAKDAPLSQPPPNHPSAETAISRKAADLKALLEKQADFAPKSTQTTSLNHNTTSNSDFSEPGASSEPAPGVPRISQLPPQIRQTLPDLSVSMLVYSKQPADRFIYVNGTKRQEGDEISRGLKVVRITRDGAIFAYKGRRFSKGVLGN